MAMTETDIKIIIAAELKKQGFDKAQKATSGLDKSFKRLAATLAATFSATQLIAFGKAAVKAFSDDEKAARRLTNTLANMGLAFEDPRVKKFISDLEATSGVLDDKLRPAMQGLLTTTGSVTKSQELLTLALDIAAQTGIDLETVTSDLAKAYVGNTKGLSKYNLGLTKAELSAKSFSEIQDILNKQFSGANAAFLETYAGKVALLNVAFANMQETIGKSLVDAFQLLAGDNGIKSATDALADFGQEIADVITGITLLIDTLKSIPGVGLLLQLLLNMKNFGVLGVLGDLGKQNRLAPAPFTTPMTISGQTDFYTKQEDARKKADAAALKRAKELAALQKKAELERLKREKEALQLKRANTIFDMENIQIVAAMQGQIDGEQRLRLVALLALNNGITEAAEKAATAVMAINAPALASLGVIVQAGDTITDVIGKLINAQAKTALVQMGITNIPKAKNPFEDWDSILKKIITDLDAIAAKIKNMPKVSGTTTTTTTTTTPSGTTTTTTIPSGGGGGGGTGANGFAYPTTPPGVSGSGSQFGSGTPWAQAAAAFMESVAGMPGVSGSASQFGANTPWALAAAATAERLASIPGMSGSSSQFGSSTPWAQAANNFSNAPSVTVVVQGSVIAQQDLVEVITDQLYDNQKAGKGLLLSSTSI